MTSDAILQIEINRKRWAGYGRISHDTPFEVLDEIIRAVSSDTLTRGGTFVLVSSTETITLVQRAKAPEMDRVIPDTPEAQGETTAEESEAAQ